MAYRINGVIRLDDSGNANLGVATATEFDGKVSEKAITEQTAGGVSDVTGADELLLYDTNSADLLRVTVDEFIGGSGIGTIVTDFTNLNIIGIATIQGQLKADGAGIGLTVANDAYIGGDITGVGSITASDFYGNGANLEGVPTDLGSLSDVELIGVTDGDSIVFNQTTGNFEAGTPEVQLPPNAVLDSLNVAGIVTFGENREIFTQSFAGTTNGSPTFTSVNMSNVIRVESYLTVVHTANDYTHDTCYFFYDGSNIRGEKPDGTPVSLSTGPIPDPDIDVGGKFSILYDASGDILSIRATRNGGGPADEISAKLVIIGYLKPEPFVP